MDSDEMFNPKESESDSAQNVQNSDSEFLQLLPQGVENATNKLLNINVLPSNSAVTNFQHGNLFRVKIAKSIGTGGSHTPDVKIINEHLTSSLANFNKITPVTHTISNFNLPKGIVISSILNEDIKEATSISIASGTKFGDSGNESLLRTTAPVPITAKNTLIKDIKYLNANPLKLNDIIGSQNLATFTSHTDGAEVEILAENSEITEHVSPIVECEEEEYLMDEYDEFQEIEGADTDSIEPIPMEENNVDIAEDEPEESINEMECKTVVVGKKVELLKSNVMINVQIQNGVLSDPNGPIKMLTHGNQDVTFNTQNIPYNLLTSNVMKHKKILELQRSPRKQRARSLNSIDNSMVKSNDIRRVSFPLLINEIKKISKFGSDENILFCNENLGNVSEIDSKRTSSSSKCSTNEDDSDFIIDYEENEESQKPPAVYEIPSNSLEASFMAPRKSRLAEPQVFPVEDDPIDTIKWDAGIGYLPNSKLKFEFNEFGLLEIMTREQFRKMQRIHRDNLNMRPLSERQDLNDPLRKRKLNKASEDTLYTCTVCLCRGLATEFHTPEYCSNICLKQHYESKGSAKITSVANNVDKKLPREIENVLICDTFDDGNVLEDADDDEGKDMYIDLDMIPFVLDEEFSWEDYIAYRQGPLANKRLFAAPSPSSFLPFNRFYVGDKLEAIDPENSCIIGVATIVEKQGYRVKVHFDGFPAAYDFWTNVDSLDLLPAGFAEATNRELHVPPNYKKHSFSWNEYLIETKSAAASRCCFPYTLLIEYENRFTCGMKLEAYDLRNSEKICVATIKDVIGNRILIHFDGWDDIYDYWVPITSPHIHPVNWHQENGFNLTHPPGTFYFLWFRYLKQTKSKPAPAHLFTNRKPMEFKVGMRLEAVDKRVPALIRPATIVSIDEYEIKIHYDGWPEGHSYWFKDDSCDIHPVKWCKKTGHTLEFPADYGPDVKNLCGVRGCRGIGNAINFDNPYHYNLDECPYAEKNLFKTRKITNRMEFRLKDFDESLIPVGRLAMKRSNSSLPDCNFKPFKKQKAKLENATKHDDAEDQDQNNLPSQSSSETSSQSSSSHHFSDINDADAENRQFNISKKLLMDYGPRLKAVRELWEDNSHNLNENIPSYFHKQNPLDWDAIAVSNYIEAMSNSNSLASIFRKHEIDGIALLSLNENDLTNILNLKLGHAIKIYNQIIHLREQCIKYLM